MRVAIALGSNLGDRRAHLDYAIDALQLDLTDISVSSFLETQPVGVGPEHGAVLERRGRRAHAAVARVC